MNVPEPDDHLHNPDPKRDRHYDSGGHIFTPRGIANLGCLFILAAGMMMLLFALPFPTTDMSHSIVSHSAGYPIYSHFTRKRQTTQGAFNFGGTNASGQVPQMSGDIGLIDIATPQSVYTKPSFADPSQQWELVFSDEFNVDGRTFYPGDDPYWEAVDLYYWQTVSIYLPTSPGRSIDPPPRPMLSGTIPSRPQQRMGIYSSLWTLRIQSATTI